MESKFSTFERCSLSLAALLHETVTLPKAKGAKRLRVRSATRAFGLQGEETPQQPLVRVLIEAESERKVRQAIKELAPTEQCFCISDGMFAATLSTDTLQGLLRESIAGLRINTKKRSSLRLEAAVRNIQLFSTATGPRQVSETGKGVFVGIVDSGFDLTHPMFRNAQGQARVAGLLEQSETPGVPDKEFDAAQLQQALAAGQTPGADEDGHGTHVASIAGGSKHFNLEGIAPEATFLLVKTNFVDTDKAVKWIFDKAGAKPCVINLSLGHHFGSHDGTDAEERLFESLTGPGKVIVASAGNERIDDLHLGGRFATNETQNVSFDILRPSNGGASEAGLTLWFSSSDKFQFTLISPSGTQYQVPGTNTGLTTSSSQMIVRRIRGPYPFNGLVQVQVHVEFLSPFVSSTRLRNWKLKCTCTNSVVGRLDGWFFNSGFAQFRPHALVEPARTIGLPTTSKACIAVASHISKNKWKSDNGNMEDTLAVVGRSSDFSSLGPTRDGREKPEISAPGQYLTAALASGSELEDWDDRSLDSKRQLTIEGTSMSAPVVTGVIALMLQKKSNLTPDKVRTILRASAARDAHTGNLDWNPTYGHGKIDVVKILSNT